MFLRAGLLGNPPGIKGEAMFVFLRLSQREHPERGQVQSRASKVVLGALAPGRTAVSRSKTNKGGKQAERWLGS